MLTMSCSTDCPACAGVAGVRRWPFERQLLCRESWRAALDAWAAAVVAEPITKAARPLSLAAL